MQDDKKDGDDLATEFLQHALMNEARAYLSRGRSLAGLNGSEVADVWVASFERWFENRTDDAARAMDDAAAELRLRGLEMPYERVSETLTKVQTELREIGPDAPSESLDRLEAEFFAARRRPKN